VGLEHPSVYDQHNHVGRCQRLLDGISRDNSERMGVEDHFYFYQCSKKFIVRQSGLAKYPVAFEVGWQKGTQECQKMVVFDKEF